MDFYLLIWFVAAYNNEALDSVRWMMKLWEEIILVFCFNLNRMRPAEGQRLMLISFLSPISNEFYVSNSSVFFSSCSFSVYIYLNISSSRKKTFLHIASMSCVGSYMQIRYCLYLLIIYVSTLRHILERADTYK